MRQGYFIEIGNDFEVLRNEWYYAEVKADVEAGLGDYIIVMGGGIEVRGTVERKIDDLMLIKNEIVEKLEGVYVELLGRIECRRVLNGIDEVKLTAPAHYVHFIKVGDELSVWVGKRGELIVGRVDKVQDGLTSAEIVVSGVLGELVHRLKRKYYQNVTVQEIVSEMLTEAGFTSEVVGEYPLDRFWVDDRMFDVIKFFADVLNCQLRVEGKKVWFEPYGYREFGGSVVVRGVSFDTSNVVNDLHVFGGVMTYTTTDSFTGDGQRKEFELSRKPAGGVRVFLDEQEVSPTAYIVNQIEKKIVFNQAPESGVNVRVEYVYEVPLNVRSSDNMSIEKYGRRSKKIVVSFIRDPEKLMEYARAYIAEFAEAKIDANGYASVYDLSDGLDVGKRVRISVEELGHEHDIVVYELTFSNMSGRVELKIGKRQYDVIEWQGALYNRVKEAERVLDEVLIERRMLPMVEQMVIEMIDRLEYHYVVLDPQVWRNVLFPRRFGLYLSGVMEVGE